jgi:serine/threonine-protein kinase
MFEGSVLTSWTRLESAMSAFDPHETTTGDTPINGPPRGISLPERYEPRGEIGLGGMGVVLRVHDRTLHRDLALKVLRPACLERPALVRRFIEEAQVAGQLQHPGVVPVHDLGQLPDGRPFIVMKLVRGRTLADLLAERPARGTERPKPSEPLSSQQAECGDTSECLVDLPRFLGIFQQICQTVAYAHSKGVLHRDLKPANVMVGAFGEVQVMDWGLAKVLADSPSREREPAETTASVVETDRSGKPDSATQAGSVLGTYAYMPPEQARGRIDQCDARSDVFGLGAVLCEILTGLPPYAGTTVEEIKSRAVLADLAPAMTRLDACGADAELAALARTCLAADPEARPRAAGAVAERLTAYLDSVQERLRRAEIDRAEAQVKAVEERKRRRLTVALAAAALLLTVLGGSGWWWIARKQAAAEAAARAALDEAVALRDQEKWADALNAAKRARDALAGGGSAALRQRIEGEYADLNLIAELDRIQLRQAEVDIQKSSFDRPRTLPDYLEAFKRYGLAPQEPTIPAAAERLQSRPGPVRNRLMAGLDDWLIMARKAQAAEQDWLSQLLSAADSDPWRVAVRQAIATQNRQSLIRLAREVDVRTQPVTALDVLGTALFKEKETAEAVALLRRAWQRYPNDFWINEGLGTRLDGVSPPKYDEAMRHHMAALAVKPDNPGVYLNLGKTLSDLKEYDKAAAANLEAIRLAPEYAAAYNNLGGDYEKLGKEREAEAAFRKSIDLNPSDPLPRANLGMLLAKQGKLEEAETLLKKALELQGDSTVGLKNWASFLGEYRKDYRGAVEAYRELVRREPLAAYYNNLGVDLSTLGEKSEALQAFLESIRLDPSDASHYYNLGRTWQTLKDNRKALAAFQEALRKKPDYAMAHYELGGVLAGMGSHDRAIAAFEEAIHWKPDLGWAYTKLGTSLLEVGRVDEGIAAFEKAVCYRGDHLATAHGRLGAALCDRKHDYERARANFEACIALAPLDAVAHYNLGNALKGIGANERAIAAYRTSLKLNPDYPSTYFNLAGLLGRTGQTDPAIDVLEKAVARNLKHAGIYDQLGRYLYAYRKDYTRAADLFQKTLAIQPNHYDAHVFLGLILANQKKEKEAEEMYRKAVRIEPDTFDAYYNLGKLLLDMDRPNEAITPLRRARELDPKLADAHIGYGFALYKAKRYAEAIPVFQEAIRLKPTEPIAYKNLVAVYRALKRPGDAESAVHQVIKLDPKNARTHIQLGDVCLEQRAWDRAKKAFEAAIQLDQNNPRGLFGRGIAHQGQQNWTAAIADYREAARPNLKSAPLFNRLGLVLLQVGDDADAAAAFRQAIHLRPDFVDGYLGLAQALSALGQREQLISLYRDALRTMPDNPLFRNNLAYNLMEHGAVDEALETVLDAVALKPDYSIAFLTLGEVYRARGQFVESLGAIRRAHQLATKQKDTTYPTAQWLKDAERLVELNKRLRRGDKPANAAEQLEFAALCGYKQLYREAVGHYEAAFAADAKTAEGLSAGHRLAAARAALRAAGLGADQQAQFRQKALTWLRADLEVWKMQAASDEPMKRVTAGRTLRRWQSDPALAGTRDPGALPEAERPAWEQWWRDVASSVEKP